MYLSTRYIDEKQIFGRYQKVLFEQTLSEAEMDPDTFRAFEDKLTKAKFTLYKEKPFFGLLLTKLRTVPTYSVPTMAVDNNANIYINPKFVIDELSPAEVTGVLAHEVMHIATETFFRQRGRRMDLWNIATDYMMNRDILEMNMSLPKMGLLPEQQGDRWIVKVEGLKPIDITDISAEELYNILLPKQEQQEKQMQKIIDKLIKEQGKLDKHLSPEEAQGIEVVGVPSEDSVYKPAQQGQGDIRAAVQDALDTAKRTRGSEAGTPRSFSGDLMKPKTNWKMLLRNFIKAASTPYYDWGRPAKRAMASGYYAPKMRMEQEDIDLVIAIDTSGSISEDIIKVFVSELLSIIRTFKKVKINLLLWHTNVYHETDIDTRKKGFEDIKKELLSMPWQGGGTEISSIKKYLDKKKAKTKKINGLLVFTDGEVEQNPQLPDAKKKLFMLTENGNDEILKKYGPTFFVDIPHSQ